ncbi:amidohydrolase family protein [Gordonia sp. NPDC003950]
MATIDDLIPGIVDAHVQQWNPRQAPWSGSRLVRGYRFVPGMGDRVFSVAVPQSEREYLLTPRSVARAYEPRHYGADIAPVSGAIGVPIESVVISESYWRLPESEEPEATRNAVDEARYLMGLPFGMGVAPALGAVMVRADPRSAGFGERLDAQIEVCDRIRGIQTTATRHPDPKVRSGGAVDGVLASAAFLTGIEAVAQRRLAVEVFVYSHQLYDVVTLAREFPDTTIIVDHFGCPVGAFGPVGTRTGTTAAARADILRLWRERMTTLASQRNVVIKMSGLALPVLGYGRQSMGNIGTRQTLVEMVGPLMQHIVAHFGASRVMFGSNFPIDKPNASVDMLVGGLLDVLEPWGDTVVRNVFRNTARRVYRIGDD